MPDPAERLHRDAAAIGARLGELLAATPRAQDGSWASAIQFLLDAFGAAGGPNGRPTPADPIDRLVERLDLTPMEAELLLLAGLAEEHEGYASVLRLLHPRGEPRPTVGLGAQLFCAGDSERFALRRVLERGNAVNAGALALSEDAPFGERSLLLAEGLWSALGGVAAWPRSLHVRHEPAVSVGLEEWFDTALARRALFSIRADRTVLIVVSIDDAELGVARALALVSHAGRDAVAARLGSAQRDADERTLSLHCLAHDVVPVVAAASDTGDGPHAVVAELATHPGVVMSVAPPGASIRTTKPVLLLPVPRLWPKARARTWRALLPALAREASTLAARYSLEPMQIAAVARDVSIAMADSGAAPTLDDVASGVRSRGEVELGAGVSLVRPTATWEQLVLSDDRMAQLHEATARRRHQTTVFDEWGFPDGRPGSRGTRLLLAGAPGTGKSLAAEAMAAELGVDLLVVDLSRLISKWLGETEKNLARVFDRAERAQAVLLFDEADALFAKRTEVADAHDRWANLETAYMLSRLERFDGLAILATNLKDQIDSAFMRRLEFVIDFEEPGVAERERLWRAHLPPRAPLARDVALAELAELYPIVGGLIRNASLAAGFLATADGGSITRHHLLHAVRREYEKAGRAFPGVPADCAGV
jgi:hypothetical protein